MQSLQQKYDDKQNEASSLRGQLANKLQQCESDKQRAADEAIKLEYVMLTTLTVICTNLCLQNKKLTLEIFSRIWANKNW